MISYYVIGFLSYAIGHLPGCVGLATLGAAGQKQTDSYILTNIRIVESTGQEVDGVKKRRGRKHSNSGLHTGSVFCLGNKLLIATIGRRAATNNHYLLLTKANL